jgi:hypothetical protein
MFLRSFETNSLPGPYKLHGATNALCPASPRSQAKSKSREVLHWYPHKSSTMHNSIRKRKSAVSFHCSARHSLDPFRWSDADVEECNSRQISQEDNLVGGPLSRLFTGIWQQQHAELNTDQKVLSLYQAEDKEEHIISYKFDLERTEMLLPQSSPLEFTLTKLMDTSGFTVGSVKFRTKTAEERDAYVSAIQKMVQLSALAKKDGDENTSHDVGMGHLCSIHPLSRQKLKWDICVMICSTLTLLMLPHGCAFHNQWVVAVPGWVAVLTAIDIVCLIDVFVFANTGQLLSGRAIDMRLSVKRAMYFNSFSFFCDVATSIPYALIIMCTQVRLLTDLQFHERSTIAKTLSN